MFARGKVAIAGLDTAGVRSIAKVGVAGNTSKFGVAGLNCNGVYDAAKHGIAGNLSSSIRRDMDKMTTGYQLGDKASRVGWQHGVFFADYTYVVCTADRGKGETLRWRRGREGFFSRKSRPLPLFLDSTAYRRWTGKAPKWTSLDTFYKAIDLTDPDGFAAYDEIGDQERSVKNFDRMCEDGYGPERGCFPVYHVRPQWRDDATVIGIAWRNISPAARCAVANARVAAQDPVLHYYADKSWLIGLGGMVRGPVPRDVRHYYIAELCRLLPEHQFWALGQANFKVVNGLGAMGLLDRVWTDGTWWILDAACERFAVVESGIIKMFSLEGVARSFFTITECMAANLRSLLSAYAGLWEWPPPDPLPLNQHDRDQAVELHRRFEQAKLELFGGDEIKLCGNVPVRVK